MLSRVADSLYWMSRYVKRTDSVLRLLKVNYASAQDDAAFTWRPVLKIFTYLEDAEISRMEKNTRMVLHYMIVEKDNPNAVATLVTKARENARSVQDNITNELWQTLNEFYHIVRDERLALALQTKDPITTLDMLIARAMLYYGIAESTMFRGEGLNFMNIGKYLERATQSVDILDVKFSDLSYDLDKTAEVTYWKHLLQSISGYALYLKTYRSGFEARNVVELIVFNNNYPLSIIYSVNMLDRYFERLKESSDRTNYDKIRFMIGRLRSKLQYSNMQTLSDQGLHKFLTELNQDLTNIGNALNEHYFAYS
ncbi:MAG TPA: alpha-E domain-containing protein [Cyclobacteriaceae bacterium]|nr:alpha-E domain-containing protein [Cyclobacteriaceae bacterium]HMV09631.1 alpha-E domain-containing protein [Cyclobacteriaceae bacterium]HMV89550.1 alpha-E domain-containing protein [Cyclobacteriaceae bacterium]HMX01037.1 alpha-E domain-containing protein [Cyclobacteriaceae bacterium]HMX52009.1 alpha-E domain-containing protein [Cyclobacteriaceae bacterium]